MKYPKFNTQPAPSILARSSLFFKSIPVNLCHFWHFPKYLFCFRAGMPKPLWVKGVPWHWWEGTQEMQRIKDKRRGKRRKRRKSNAFLRSHPWVSLGDDGGPDSPVWRRPTLKLQAPQPLTRSARPLLGCTPGQLSVATVSRACSYSLAM